MNSLPFHNQDRKVNQSRMKRNSRFRIGWYHLLIAVTLVGLFGYFGGFIVVDWTKSGDDSTLNDKTCTTTACQDDADLLIRSMNISVDPCENFYEYACGGWIANNPVAENGTWRSPFTDADYKVYSDVLDILKTKHDQNDPAPVNQARDLYASCMDTDLRESVGLQPLLDVLISFGGWPMTLKAWDQDVFSWQTMTASMTRLYKTGVLLHVSNRPDLMNASENAVHVDPTSFILSRPELDDPSRVTSYTEFITGAATLIRDAMKSTASGVQIDIDVAEMLKFEHALSSIASREETSRMYNPMSLLDLQLLTDSVKATKVHAKINWFEYLNNIYNTGAGIQILNNDRIIVEETAYLQKLVTLLDETPLRTIANYVHWNLVHQLGTKTNKKMRDLNSHFIGRFRLSTTCAHEAKTYFGFAIIKKYVVSYKIEKNEAVDMVDNLKRAFKSLASKADWMDHDSKRKVREKVDYMKANVGYPDWVMIKASLENYYSSLFTSRDKYFVSYQNASKFLNEKTFKKLRVATDRDSWDNFLEPPVSATCYYSRRSNEIAIPAGILHFPHYKRGRLASLNYGGIGMFMGHEITHGFDNTGRLYNKYGSFTGFSIVHKDTFLERAQCFIDQYSDYASPSGTYLNGKKTLNENIADNGAVRQMYVAYKLHVAANGIEPKLPGLETFTPEQLLFLSYANIMCASRTPESLENQIQSGPHSPANFRVIGALSNSEDFVTHFNCPTGSRMNRVDKCTIW